MTHSDRLKGKRILFFVGDIYEDMAGRVAMDNPDTQEFQENLDYRYYSTLRQIDQSDLTSSLDDKGLEYVGNLTIRVIAGSLATLLEAKADGRLADEVNKLGNDDEWFLETSKAMLSDFVEEVAMMSVYGFDVIGRHRDYGDQDQYIYETIIEGYANGAMSDEISGTLTEEQIEVTAFYEMSNVATLFGSFQTVLGEILPNEGINEPDEIERSDMYHEATRIAAVERQAPSDVTITEDINQPQGIEII